MTKLENYELRSVPQTQRYIEENYKIDISGEQKASQQSSFGNIDLKAKKKKIGLSNLAIQNVKFLKIKLRNHEQKKLVPISIEEVQARMDTNPNEGSTKKNPQSSDFMESLENLLGDNKEENIEIGGEPKEKEQSGKEPKEHEGIEESKHKEDGLKPSEDKRNENEKENQKESQKKELLIPEEKEKNEAEKGKANPFAINPGKAKIDQKQSLFEVLQKSALETSNKKRKSKDVPVSFLVLKKVIV